jgi:antitoxin ParD1/3/4
MDITLSPQTEAFVRRKLDSGTYPSLSELVNDALRLMAVREKRLAELKNAIQIGIAQAERGEWIDAEEVFTALQKRMTA